MKITSDDLDGSVPEQEKSYQVQGQQQAAGGGSTGSSMAKWSSTLRELNQVLQQLNQMGIVQGMGGNQQPAQPQQNQQPQQQSREAQQGEGQDINQQVNQKFQQAVGLMQMLPQEDELSEDTTLGEAEQWLLQNEQSVKEAMRNFVESGGL